MKMSEKSMIYWIFIDIKDDFSIKSNEMIMIMISIDTMLMMMNLWMLRRSLMIFIFDTWTNHANLNQSRFDNQLSREENTFMQTWIIEERK